MPVVCMSHSILAIWRGPEGVIFMPRSLTTFEVRQAGLNTSVLLIAASAFLHLPGTRLTLGTELHHKVSTSLPDFIHSTNVH